MVNTLPHLCHGGEDDAAAVLASVDLAHTLFVLVSKSGTTLETLTNESFVKDALAKAGLDASKHMIAVTSETSPLAKSDDYLAAFFMDDYIGGRFSSTSGVGGAVLSLAFGPEVFDMFLAGAQQSIQIFIFSKKYEEIADAITYDLKRGVTVIPAKGWYTKNDVNVVMVVARKTDLTPLLRYIKGIDSDAFISIGNTMGVYGKGFDTIKVKAKTKELSK